MPRKPIVSREDIPVKPRVVQVSIKVADLDRSDAFYTNVVGMQRRFRYRPNETVEERFYAFESDPAETLICLIRFADEPQEPVTPSLRSPMMFVLTVPDVKSIVAKTVDGGGTILQNTITQEVMDYRRDMAFIADPDGATIELTHFYL
jgi:catechol 2,3-dioxygenase-like lactoylglutathione lyase family enzyme